ncbi:MAG: hypothetical protein ABSC23_02955 [Bryobacteraceae bacterium]|jgi:uncharacterized protein (DUF697 family)
MPKVLKQVRAAFSLLNPREVRRRAGRSVRFGLVATGSQGYAEMETFLIPPRSPEDAQAELRKLVYRADDPAAPGAVDLVLYEEGLHKPSGAYVFHPRDPGQLIHEILGEHDRLALALARLYPAFRKPVVERFIHSIARENAVFAIATALPDALPSFAEIPWAFGEFASDTVFLTANQVRMAFLIAAACGKRVGYARQKAEIAAIAGGAFGWRAIARELAGKIPFGGGLVPKGAMAYAATYAIGKGLERLYQNGKPGR